MILGARIGCWADRKPTARDYVQDGLVAMWDGIENAGWGVHDPNARVWKDLTGNGYDMSAAGWFSRFAWSDRSLYRIASYVTSNVGCAMGMNTEMLKRLYVKIANTDNTFEFCASRAEYTTAEHVNGFAVQEFYIYGNNSALFIFGLYKSSNKMAYSIKAPQTSASSNAQPSGAPLYSDLNHATGVCTRKFNGADPARLRMTVNGGLYPVERTPSFVDRTGEKCDAQMICPGGGHTHCLRIYDRVLTDEEIARNYAIDKIRFNLP